MPTYNGQQFILEMLNSILNQTREVDELIISDDGSFDNTVPIIKKFLAENASLNSTLLVNKKNIGINKNLTKAIKCAAGSFLLLADQDDTWEEFKVEKFVEEHLKGNHYIISDMKIIDEDSNFLPFTWSDYCLARRGLSTNFLINGCATGMSMQFINACLPIPPGKGHDVWFGYCARRLDVRHYIKEPLMRYRFNPEGTTSKIFSKDVKSENVSDETGVIKTNYNRRIYFKKNFYKFKYCPYVTIRILMLLFFIKVKILWNTYRIKNSLKVNYNE
jgi:glycosyltransferase involved in cell wall biosynthesis